MFRKIIKGLKDVWCGTLEFDTEPKKGSFNPVTSDGVYEAINGAGGAKEIVYFDVDPSDPPSGIYAAITEALSNNKLPAVKIDGAVYLYTATGTDKYVFVGGFTKESVGYTEIEVSDDDSVTSKSVDDKVYNMYILYQDDPASPGETPSDEDQWVCDADKHVITKDELIAAHADCRYFILNNAVEPDSNSRKYFASVTVISNSYIRLRFYMMQYDAQGVAEFYQKTVVDDSEGRLYILSSYSATLAGTIQAVLVSEPQSFDSTQKAQGRANIGAASASDVTALQSQVSSLSDVSAYTVKGEATVVQLNAGPSGIQAGWAYQLTDSGTLTDGSLAVVAGDTVAWDGTKWFPLVKSDYYATKTYAQNVAHSIATEYNGTTGAVAGKIYMHDGKSYLCKTETSGDFDYSKFYEVPIADLLELAENSLEDKTVKDVDVTTELSKTTGGYVAFNGSVTENANYEFYTLSAKAGQVFDVRTTSGILVASYIFLDTNGNVLARENPTSETNANHWNYDVIAPDGTASVVVNNSIGATVKLILKYGNLNVSREQWSSIADIANAGILAAASNGDVGKLNIANALGLSVVQFEDSISDNWTKTDNYLYTVNGSSANNNWEYYERNVSAGVTYYIDSYAGNAARLWLFLDSNGAVIADSGNVTEGHLTATVCVPNNAVKLVCNHKKGNSYPFVAKTVKLSVSEENIDKSIPNKIAMARQYVESTTQKDVVCSSACEMTDNTIFKVDGTTSSSSTWAYYSIDVKYGQVFNIYTYSGSAAKAYLFLDSNDTVIAYEQNAPGTASQRWIYGLMVPEGAVKMVMNHNKTGKFSLVQKYGNLNVARESWDPASAFANAGFMTSGSNGDVAKMNLSALVGTEVKTFEDSISDNWTKTENYCYTPNGASSNILWDYYERNVVEGHVFYVKSFAGSSARLWLFLDSNGSLISDSGSMEVGVHDATVVVPNGAAKLIVNRKKDESQEFVAKTVQLVIDSKNVEGAEIDKSSNRLFGKTLVVCGDSIPYGADIGQEGITDYPTITMYLRNLSTGNFDLKTTGVNMSFSYQIAARNGMTLYNDAIGGTMIEQGPNGTANSFSYPNGRYTTLPDNIDYLVIWFGTNDFAYGTLGTKNDDSNGTYYGAFNVVMPYLLNKYPNAKICLAITCGTNDSWRQAVRDMANKWGVACFDMFGKGTPLFWDKDSSVGIDPDVVTAWRANFMATSAHPNYAAHTMLADRLEAFLRTI